MPRRPSREALELLPLLQLDPLQDEDDMASNTTHKQPHVVDEKYDADDVHVERASSGLSSPEPFVITAEEKRLVRKLDMRIMPIACILYLFACEYISLVA